MNSATGPPHAYLLSVVRYFAPLLAQTHVLSLFFFSIASSYYVNHDYTARTSSPPEVSLLLTPPNFPLLAKQGRLLMLGEPPHHRQLQRAPQSQNARHICYICPQICVKYRIASYYYVNYHTIATFNEHLKPTMGDIELVRLFALADEFKYMVVREVSAELLV